MIATRHMSVEVELVRWLLLIAAAIVLLLAIATALAADPMKEPGRLPDAMRALAQPMPAEVERPYFPETPPARQLPPAEAAARVAAIIEHHRAGRTLEALNGWEEVGLPVQTAHWREIAMGAAYLRAGDLNRAALHLEAARQLAPGHAIAAYFTGLLRLEQAADVTRVRDGMPRGDLFVGFTPMEDRALYRMLAIDELQIAITRAGDIRLDERLLAIDPQYEYAMIVPMAGQLTAALGADDFVGKAHNVLFGLHLKQGDLRAAEDHLDRAVATGIAPLYGYRDLAMAYQDEGQAGDAMRAMGKDFQANHPEARQFIDWIYGLRHDATQETWIW